MKYKKIIFTGIAAAALVGAVYPVTKQQNMIVNAATAKKKLHKKAYVYNAKGKRVKIAALKKGKKIKILGIKIIKGKKYYKIGKNRYVRVANFSTVKKHHAVPAKTPVSAGKDSNTTKQPTSNIPSVPATSNNSGTPATPNNSDTPATPNNSGTPATPNNSGTPATPNNSDTPATPNQPSVPSSNESWSVDENGDQYIKLINDVPVYDRVGNHIPGCFLPKNLKFDKDHYITGTAVLKGIKCYKIVFYNYIYNEYNNYNAYIKISDINDNAHVQLPQPATDNEFITLKNLLTGTFNKPATYPSGSELGAKYDLSSPDKRLAYDKARAVAEYVSKDARSSSTDLKKATKDLERAYSNLNG